MKRTIAGLLAAILCLSLAACGSSGKAPAISLHNKETDANVTLGMEKKEVEALLGEGTQENPFMNSADQKKRTLDSKYTQMSYGQGQNSLTVIYQGDKAVVIKVQSLKETDVSSNWGTKEGLYCDSSKEDMQKKQGEGIAQVSEQDVSDDPTFQGLEAYDYYYQADGASADDWQTGGAWLQALLQEGRVFSLSLSSLSPATNLFTKEAE